MGTSHVEDNYVSVFSTRYCPGSKLLTYFSESYRAKTWRQLWVWLAEGEKKLGLNLITDEMIKELIEKKDADIDWVKLRFKEKQLKHDVMAHIELYKEACPTASGIIHLGATSCFVQDNSDLIIQRNSFIVILSKLATLLKLLDDFASKYANVFTVGRTHFQPASFVTVGKRACIWAHDILMAAKNVKLIFSTLQFRGIKGATGTQDSFLTLFNRDEEKVKNLDDFVTKKAGFSEHFNISGQTYSRQQDTFVLFSLSNIGSVVAKIATDIRLLQSWNEIREPFEENQIGSSAMPYKRNPMKCERICGISRDLMKSVQNGLENLACQGLERTLDDSSNRRKVIPEAFLAAEAVLTVLNNVIHGLRVEYDAIKKNNQNELPFVAMEKALVLLSEKGADRQEVHSKIRTIVLQHIHNTARDQINLESMLEDTVFDGVRDEIMTLSQDILNFCGRSVSQINEFLDIELRPFLKCLLEISGVKLDETFDLSV